MQTAMQAAFDKAKIMISNEVTKQQKAFLSMIAWSELGTEMISSSDNGYNVIVTSTPKTPILFSSYADHPNRLMILKNKKGVVIGKSTAAGRYQILHNIFVFYAKQLVLKDFSPASQDQIALQLIKECHALADIETGDLESAVGKTAHIWASLCGSPYGQPTNSILLLQKAFIDAGGILK